MEQIDVTNPDPKKDKKVMEEARSMMAEIFPSLENELLHFISFYERGDSFFTLHALVRLSKHVLSTQVSNVIFKLPIWDNLLLTILNQNTQF